MARIIKLNGPIAALRGSVSKDSGVTFKTMYGKIYMVRKPRPRTTPYTNDEIARWRLFGDINKKVSDILKDDQARKPWQGWWKKSGYKQKTLRGYIFSQLYKQAVEKRNEQN